MSRAPGSAAWSALPADVSSRRAIVAGCGSAVAALLGGAASHEASALDSLDIRPGSVRPSGTTENIDYEDGADPPEVVAKRWAARVEGEKKRKEVKEKFRVVFGEFAAEGVPMEDRIAKMQELSKIVVEEKRLPIGITREDVVAGVRSVKYELGCVKLEQRKGDCKKLELAFNKFMNVIDKNMYKGISSNR